MQKITGNLDCNHYLSEFNNSDKLAATIPSSSVSKSMTESDDVEKARNWPTTKNNIQVSDNQPNSHNENEVMNLDPSMNEISKNTQKESLNFSEKIRKVKI